MNEINKNRILILGIGNTLLSDEGFGPSAIHFLEENYAWPANVHLVDGATLGLMLMAELLEHDLVIILDITLGDEPPGTFYSLTPEDMDKSLSSRYSMHQTSINDVIISCELAGHKPETCVYAMQPFDYNTFSPFITEKAQKLLPEFCEKVVRELKKKGISCQKL